MGHGQKNANRGEAIARNAARIGKLKSEVNEKMKFATKKATALGERLDALEKFKGEAQSIILGLNARVRLLERPWWKRILGIGKTIQYPTTENGDSAVHFLGFGPRPEGPTHHVLDIHSGQHEVEDTNPPAVDPDDEDTDPGPDVPTLGGRP